jgi:Spy/CpxP family protein refolding chaperone
MTSLQLNNQKTKGAIQKWISSALLLCMILIAGSSYAQQGGSRGGGQGGGQRPPKLPTTKEIKEMVSDMAKEISLNEEQEDEILDIYQAHFDEVEEKTKSGRPDRNAMESLKTNFEKEVNAVLTEEQQELYSAYLKENSSKQRSRSSRE